MLSFIIGSLEELLSFRGRQYKERSIHPSSRNPIWKEFGINFAVPFRSKNSSPQDQNMTAIHIPLTSEDYTLKRSVVARNYGVEPHVIR
jgi:hypothetical protein